MYITHVSVSEQTLLGVVYPRFGDLVVKDEPSELSCTRTQIADFYQVFRETSSEAPVMLVGIKGTLSPSLSFDHCIQCT